MNKSPFIYSCDNKRYYTLNYYNKSKFGKKIYKAVIDCGLTCPNIDGTKGIGGCIFCDGGSGYFVHSGLNIKEQLEREYERISGKYGRDAEFIAYFQAFTNTYAPEHLIISTEDDKAVLDKIKNAGSIFLGKYSPVAAGDYGSGTNHVLPTGGGAKMYSGLSTEAFLKKPTVQTITKEGIEELSKTVIPIAEYEGFYAHANSVKVRLDKK